MPLKTKILPLFFIILSVSAIAQSNNEWSKIGLSASGNNIQNGVEAFYKLGLCGDKQVVFIKFTNHNSYTVKVEWNDAVFTDDLIWLTASSENIKKQVTIVGNETIFGDCSDERKKNLLVNISSFIKTPDTFKLFGIKSFKVSKSK